MKRNTRWYLSAAAAGALLAGAAQRLSLIPL